MKNTLVILMLLCGCAGSIRHTSTTYEGLPLDPVRDSERAGELNAQALRLIEKDELDQAADTLKNALAADVTFGPAHNNLGWVYFHQSKLYRAAWEFQYAAKLMPNNPEPHNNLGLVLEAAGKLDQAVQSYEKALSLQSENPQLIGNLARARLRRGDEDEQTVKLLEDLIMKDTRPDWVNWAKQKRVTVHVEEDN